MIPLPVLLQNSGRDIISDVCKHVFKEKIKGTDIRN